MLSPAAYRARLNTVSQDNHNAAVSQWAHSIIDSTKAEPSTTAMLHAMAVLLGECYPDLNSGTVTDETAALKQEFALFAEKAAQPNRLYRHIDLGMADGFCREEFAITSCMLAFRAAPTLTDLVVRDILMRSGGIHSPENVKNILDEIGLGKDERESHLVLLYDSLQMLERTISAQAGYGVSPAILNDTQTFAVLNQLIEFRRNGADFCSLPDPNQHNYQEQLGRQLAAYRDATKDEINPLDVTGKITNKSVPIRCGFFTVTANSLTTNIEGVNPAYLANPNSALHRFQHALQLAALLPDSAIDYDRGTRANISALSNTIQNANGMDAKAILTLVMEILARESNAQAKSQIGAYLRQCQNYGGYVKGGIGETIEGNRKRLLLWPEIHVGTHGVEEDHARSALAMVRLFIDTMHPPPVRSVIEALRACRTGGFLPLHHNLMDSMADTLGAAREKARFVQRDTGTTLFIPPNPLEAQVSGLLPRLRRASSRYQLG